MIQRKFLVASHATFPNMRYFGLLRFPPLVCNERRAECVASKCRSIVFADVLGLGGLSLREEGLAVLGIGVPAVNELGFAVAQKQIAKVHRVPDADVLAVSVAGLTEEVLLDSCPEAGLLIDRRDMASMVVVTSIRGHCGGRRSRGG